MSCEFCQDLCVKYVIREPRQLSLAIRIAHNAVKEEIISEVSTISNWNQYTFSECAEQMIWGDIVDYHFACNHCGTSFVLGAETYHGSGGYWSPESEKPTEIIN